MSYWETKQARNAAFIASIHGGPDLEPTPTDTPDFDGGVRVGEPVYSPLHDNLQPVAPRQGDRWGAEYEIENGASLLFSWIEDER